MGTPTPKPKMNGIYRPELKQYNENLGISLSEQPKINVKSIPVWDDKFYNIHRSRWTIKLVQDPVGEGRKPTLSRAAECAPGECKDLTPEALTQLWKIYQADFDGVFKRTNSYGKVDYYFWRSPINDSSPSDAICKGDTLTLSGTFSKTEGVVLELWTPLSERIGFAACSSAPNGEHYYKANFRDPEIYKLTKSGLDNLIASLEWKTENPNKENNPHNPHNLPLDISLEKAKALRSQLRWNDAKEIGRYGLYGIGVAVGALVAGAGFAISADYWHRWKGGPPSAGSSGGEKNHTNHTSTQPSSNISQSLRNMLTVTTTAISARATKTKNFLVNNAAGIGWTLAAIGAGAATAVLIADDATGIGAIDDWLIAITGPATVTFFNRAAVAFRR